MSLLKEAAKKKPSTFTQSLAAPLSHLNPKQFENFTCNLGFQYPLVMVQEGPYLQYSCSLRLRRWLRRIDLCLVHFDIWVNPKFPRMLTPGPSLVLLLEPQMISGCLCYSDSFFLKSKVHVNEGWVKNVILITFGSNSLPPISNHQFFGY